MTKMKRYYFLLAFLLMSSLQLWAQGGNGSKGTGSTYYRANDTSRMLDIRERLVQLALQNPTFEIADRKVSVARYQIAKAKGNWFSGITPALNLNKFTVGSKSSGNQFLPLYNVVVTMPLNYFSLNKNEVKVARQNYYIAEAEKNERFREVRLAVLTSYEDYLMYKELLDLQNRVTQDFYLQYRQRESDFKEDAITVEEYNKVFAAYKEQQDRKLKAQRDFNVSKLELERLIGIPIEEVLEKK